MLPVTYSYVSELSFHQSTSPNIPFLRPRVSVRVRSTVVCARTGACACACTCACACACAFAFAFYPTPDSRVRRLGMPVCKIAGIRGGTKAVGASFTFLCTTRALTVGSHSHSLSLSISLSLSSHSLSSLRSTLSHDSPNIHSAQTTSHPTIKSPWQHLYVHRYLLVQCISLLDLVLPVRFQGIGQVFMQGKVCGMYNCHVRHQHHDPINDANRARRWQPPRIVAVGAASPVPKVEQR